MVCASVTVTGSQAERTHNPSDRGSSPGPWKRGAWRWEAPAHVCRGSRSPPRQCLSVKALRGAREAFTGTPPTPPICSFSHVIAPATAGLPLRVRLPDRKRLQAHFVPRDGRPVPLRTACRGAQGRLSGCVRERGARGRAGGANPAPGLRRQHPVGATWLRSPSRV